MPFGLPKLSHLPLLLSAALFPVSLAAQVNTLPPHGVVDLAKVYRLDANNGSEMVGAIFPDAQALMEQFPAWSAHWQTAGKDMASFQRLSLLVCAWNDAVLQAGKQLSGTRSAPTEFVVPPGIFRVDHPLLLMPGTFRGAGNATVLMVDPANWSGAPGEALMHLTSWGAAAMAGRTVQLDHFELEGAPMTSGIHTPHEAIRLEVPQGMVHLDHVSVRGFRGAGVVVAGAAGSHGEHLVLESNGAGMALLGCTGDHTYTRVSGSDNGARFRIGPWGALASACSLHGEDLSLGAGLFSDTPAGTDRLIVSDGPVNARFERVLMKVDKVVPASLCLVRNSTPGSTVSVIGMQVEGRLQGLLNDATRSRSFQRSGVEERGTFGFCWNHDLAQGELPDECGTSQADGRGTVTGPPGGLKSGEGNTIGSPTGGALGHVNWGFNCSSLFAITTGNDTALQGQITQIAPGLLRFPGGTLANFTHPSGLGYGMRATDLVMVEGTDVHNTVSNMYTGEQASISAGQITRNYLYDVIDMALATDQKVLFVANLLNGTVAEMMTSLNTLVNAGVELAGVELGNESHLRAYESRFGTHDNYIAVAAPYAQAITNAYPELPIGVNGYPPGVLKGLGPGGTQRAHDWNVAVSNASFGDALVIHCYSRPDDCNQASVIPNFQCGAEFSRVYAREKMTQALDELSSLGDRDIWITEWNIDGGYSHYGNSIAQAMFYADMAITMAEHPRVTVSAVHNLLSMDIGYNVVRKVWPGYTPQINHYTSRLMAPLLMSGNVPQSCSLNETAGLRAMAFLSPDQQTQHLYIINRSGTHMDLAGFVGEGSNVTVQTLGGDDLASGSGPNDARPTGEISTAVQVVADIRSVQLPAYGIVHLSWAATPPEPTPSWASTFAGQDDCRLTATTGSDVVQSITGRCADVGGGKVVTTTTSSFPVSIQTKRIVLEGVTFQSIAGGKWVNGRAKFTGPGGVIKDPTTGQVLATVQAGQYYPELVLEYNQPITLPSLIGKPNGGQATAAMTIKGMRIYP